jgi:uroporphyrinogen decarboxylase
MKPRDWGLMALDRRPMPVAADGRRCRPPMLELSMEITQELFGRRWITLEDLEAVSGAARVRLLHEKAETYLITAAQLGSPFIRVRFFPTLEDELETIRHLQRLGVGDYLLCAEADNTFRIPNGDDYLRFVYDVVDHPEDVLDYASRWCDEGIERGKRLIDAGVEVITMCADYCFNDGPFLSPRQWDRFIGQFYYRQVAALKAYGARIIKHTDGEIDKLLDRLVAPGIDALHSIDPMAGVDIAEIKRRVGDRVCLIGNVHLGKLQGGTREEIFATARYCLEHGSPGGGYIYASCNSIFPGVPAESYLYMLDIWRDFGPSPLEA